MGEKMKSEQYVKGIIVALSIAGFSTQSIAVTHDFPVQQQTYSNYAEAQQAAHIAEHQANTVSRSLDASLNHLNEAEKQLRQGEMSGVLQQMMPAKTTVEDARDMYMDMLSDMSGVSRRNISDMHAAGASWSEMAGELGMQITVDRSLNSGSENMTDRGPGVGHRQGTNGQQAHQGSGIQMDSSRIGAMMVECLAEWVLQVVQGRQVPVAWVVAALEEWGAAVQVEQAVAVAQEVECIKKY